MLNLLPLEVFFKKRAKRAAEEPPEASQFVAEGLLKLTLELERALKSSPVSKNDSKFSGLLEAEG